MSPLPTMKVATIKIATIKTIRPTFTFLLPLVLAITLALTAQHAFAKKDLFSSEPTSSQATPAQEMIASPADDADIEEPAISATDAALRAQQHVEGKVMNVRQFQDENKTLYGVKVLQKNGRIKTINIDANNGTVVE